MFLEASPQHAVERTDPSLKHRTPKIGDSANCTRKAAAKMHLQGALIVRTALLWKMGRVFGGMSAVYHRLLVGQQYMIKARPSYLFPCIVLWLVVRSYENYSLITLRKISSNQSDHGVG